MNSKKDINLFKILCMIWRKRTDFNIRKIVKKSKILVKFGMKQALLCNSFYAFYGSFILSIVIFAVIKKYLPIYVISEIYMIIRIIYRKHILKECEFVQLVDNKGDFKEDQKLRANYFGDITGIILYVVLSLSMLNPNSILVNGIMSIPITYCIIYFICAYGSVFKNSIILKAITILCSTIQGVMIILLTVVFALEKLVYFLQNIVETSNSVELMQFEISDVAQGIVLVTYMLEKYPIFTMVPMLISIILFAVLIYMTPIYQLSKLKLTFQGVNILMVLIGILSFFVAHYVGDFIDANRIMLFDSDMYREFQNEFQNEKYYFESFGAGNIKNLIYLSALPYTFGILTANVITEIRLKYAKQKSDSILEYMKESGGMTETEKNRQRKKYYYYGGDKLTFDMYEKIYEIRE